MGRGAIVSRRLGIGSVGVWLLFLYAVTIVLSLASLSFHQFQQDIHRYEGRPLTTDNSKPRYSVGEVVEFLHEWERRKSQLAEARRQLADFDDDAGNLVKQRNAIENRMWKAQNEMKAAATEIETRLQVLGSKKPLKPDVWKSLQDRVSEFSDNEPLLEAWGAFVDADTRRYNSRTELKSLDNNIDTREQTRDSLNDTLNKLRSDIQNPPFNDTGLKGFLGQLLWIKRLGAVFNSDFVFSAATMPSIMLTLVLTISMGALGSVIFLTTAYFEDDGSTPFSWYLFRPFLGMVTAFTIFVLAKAGQLTLSTGGMSDGLSEDLSPYVISFLAIISGLLSEQAINRISGVGQNFFKNRVTGHLGGGEEEPGQNQTAGAGEPEPAPTELWGVGLKAASDAAGRDADALAADIGLTKEVVESWLNLDAPVPADQQKALAELLGAEAAALFSAEKPDTGTAG
ncbi:MAG: hypothetical protein QF797_00630 [Alphaproteobacteria bacterium]|nr:hypothetical protein [Alphaproteobacteria bacterium]